MSKDDEDAGMLAMDCRTCTAMRQRMRGCESKGTHTNQSTTQPSLRMDRCPKLILRADSSLYQPDVSAVLHMVSDAKEWGVLPFGGTTRAQPAAVLEAMRLVRNVWAEMEARLIQKHRDKRHA